MTGNGQVMEPLLAVARELPAPVVAGLVASIRACGNPPSEVDEARVLSCVAGTAPRDQIQVLMAAWRASPETVDPRALGFALEAAAALDSWHRSRQTIELVWTGPAPHGTTLRRTDQALLELIRAARRKLVIVTFAAYRVAEIRLAFIEAADRGVDVTFIVESPKESKGNVTIDPMVAMGSDLAARCKVWIWPLDQRPRDGNDRPGSLHVKCAIADDDRLLVSSANLTGHAMALNMELGILVEGGELPRTVASHLGVLMTTGVLRSVS